MRVDHLAPMEINVKGKILDAVAPVSVMDVMGLFANVKMKNACVAKQSPVAMVSQLYCVVCNPLQFPYFYSGKLCMWTILYLWG